MSASTPDQTLPPRVLVGAWCAAIFQQAAAFGVRDVVISPGSRNTPLTVAALRTPELRCHSVVDERSAGFFALGVARASRVPTLLLCTSGTAAAHYYPALIEASYDGVPLMILSADRPEELQNCGAPQTIEQRNLFGTFVRGAASLSSPTEEVEAFVSIRHTVRDLLHSASSERPGPVHLNVPLRKPLEPLAPSGEFEEARVAELSRGLVPSVEPAAFAPLPTVDHLIAARQVAKRPLVTAGPLAPWEVPHVAACAQMLGVPVLQEYGTGPLSGLDFCGALLVGEHEPDLIIHFGPPAVSSAWSQRMEQYRGRYLVCSGSELREPSRRAEKVVVAPLDRVSAAIRASLFPSSSAEGSAPPVLPAAEGFAASLRPRVHSAIHRALSSFKEGAALSEPLAVAKVLSACSSEHSLVLGNSLSLRLASWVWPMAEKLPHPFTARGVNGIDGMIAWSAGVAEATRRPTLALLGDVTLAHDIGSLQLFAQRSLPICFVVLDNAGGRIFDHLPVGGAITAEEMAFWTTPPQVDFVAVAEAFGVAARRVSSIDDIGHTVAAALKAETPSLVVIPTHPSSTGAFLAEVRAELAS